MTMQSVQNSHSVFVVPVFSWWSQQTKAEKWSSSWTKWIQMFSESIFRKSQNFNCGTFCQHLDWFVCVFLIDDRLYSANSPISWADSLRSHVVLHEWLAFYSAFFWISTEVVYLQCWHGWCHMKLQPSCVCVCACVWVSESVHIFN